MYIYIYMGSGLSASVFAQSPGARCMLGGMRRRSSLTIAIIIIIIIIIISMIISIFITISIIIIIISSSSNSSVIIISSSSSRSRVVVIVVVVVVVILVLLLVLLLLCDSATSWHTAVRQIIGYANWTATRHRVVTPAKWNWSMTTGMTALWRVAPPKTVPQDQTLFGTQGGWKLDTSRSVNKSPVKGIPEGGLRQESISIATSLSSYMLSYHFVICYYTVSWCRYPSVLGTSNTLPTITTTTTTTTNNNNTNNNK